MDDEALRSVSRGLLGNKHKLEVLAAIAEAFAEGAQDVYPRMISKMVGDAADKQVNEIFTQLRNGGLLVRVEDKTDQQKHRYRARETSAWEAARTLVEELRAAAWSPDELAT
ncbi:hypothetical protein [Mycolicibacterium iranicum]|uniref:PadR family transcriptional regulator n=1 Tax=Mycolicibacterium iranicum TaxID=912594 RepID=A0A1X1WPU5_MYCIR|nr:hypothetical protein [Mycolicibacterium iranicum]ORV88627.1 hypothetical protein AWC12_12025 [Mycolicibacterium iranicum]